MRCTRLIRRNGALFRRRGRVRCGGRSFRRCEQFSFSVGLAGTGICALQGLAWQLEYEALALVAQHIEGLQEGYNWVVFFIIYFQDLLLEDNMTAAGKSDFGEESGSSTFLSHLNEAKNRIGGKERYRIYWCEDAGGLAEHDGMFVVQEIERVVVVDSPFIIPMGRRTL
jgi:hypothetical protein